jgi:uroporphyrinogen decarboxylase
MRQAGRYMPEFRELRSRVGFLDLCKDSALACEVTVMAAEQLGVDAAIIFADILLPLEPLGVGLEYARAEGPVIHRPVRMPADVDALNHVNSDEHLAYVLESLRLTRRALKDDIALIGFAGAPFTLASYMIEGGSSRNFEQTKQFMYKQPQAWARLMQRLTDLTGQYLLAQVAAGADALQLFDSWVGCLSPSDYERFVLPYSKQVCATIRGVAPLIHFGTGTAGLLHLMSSAGGDVIGVDWRIGLDRAWQLVGPQKAVQGNLDPLVLLAPPEEMEIQAARVLNEAGGRRGHIFNLGHGVLPPTDPGNVKRLVEFVHARELSQHD